MEVLAMENGHIVAVREKNQLGMAFHPELNQDERVHQYFITMIKERVLQKGNIY